MDIAFVDAVIKTVFEKTGGPYFFGAENAARAILEFGRLYGILDLEMGTIRVTDIECIAYFYFNDYNFDRYVPVLLKIGYQKGFYEIYRAHDNKLLVSFYDQEIEDHNGSDYYKFREFLLSFFVGTILLTSTEAISMALAWDPWELTARLIAYIASRGRVRRDKLPAGYRDRLDRLCEEGILTYTIESDGTQSRLWYSVTQGYVAAAKARHAEFKWRKAQPRGAAKGKARINRKASIAGNTSTDSVRAFPEPLKVAAWNLEKSRRGGADPVCAICGKPIEAFSDCHADHIIPFSKGGQTVASNLQLVHAHCNLKKNNRMTPQIAATQDAYAHSEYESHFKHAKDLIEPRRKKKLHFMNARTEIRAYLAEPKRRDLIKKWLRLRPEEYSVVYKQMINSGEIKEIKSHSKTCSSFTLATKAEVLLYQDIYFPEYIASCVGSRLAMSNATRVFGYWSISSLDRLCDLELLRKERVASKTGAMTYYIADVS
jgi:5-methylcytosine-specific restriction endonuclease McrA